MKTCKICGEETDAVGPYCTGTCADQDDVLLCTECGAVLPPNRITCCDECEAEGEP